MHCEAGGIEGHKGARTVPFLPIHSVIIEVNDQVNDAVRIFFLIPG